MERMNMFGGQSFTEELKRFKEECGIPIGDGYKWFSPVETYLKKLYDEGRLEHSRHLDEFLKQHCVLNGQDEYDISYTRLQAMCNCLIRGAHIQNAFNSYYVPVAVDEYCNLTGAYGTLEREFAVAKMLCDDKDYKKVLRSLTGKAYESKGIYGIALSQLIDLINISGIEDKQLYSDYSLMDKLLIMSYMSEGNDYEKAVNDLHFFFGKGFPYDIARLLVVKFDTDCKLPTNMGYTDLFGLVVKYECKNEIYNKKPITLASILAKYFGIMLHIKKDEMAEILAAMNAIYDAGYSMHFLYEYSKFTEENFVNLARLVLRVSKNFEHILAYNNPRLMKDYFYQQKRISIMSGENLFDLLRYVIDCLAVTDYNNYDNYYFPVYYLDKWLNDIQQTYRLKLIQNGKIVPNYYNKLFTDIKVTFDGRTAFHAPAEFFMEIIEGVSKKLHTDKCYKVLAMEVIECKDVSSNMLLLRFTSDNKLVYSHIEKPLGLTVDIETKKELILKSDLSLSSPLLKVMLYDKLKQENKDTSILADMDMQTMIAMIQAIILQNSEEYKVLFSRPDMFLNGFSSLKWCIRSDDNFYSALARYVIAVAGIDSYYGKTRISKSLSDNVDINGNSVPLISVFAGNTTIVDYLKNNPGVQISLEGDVLHFA